MAPSGRKKSTGVTTTIPQGGASVEESPVGDTGNAVESSEGTDLLTQTQERLARLEAFVARSQETKVRKAARMGQEDRTAGTSVRRLQETAGRRRGEASRDEPVSEEYDEDEDAESEDEVEENGEGSVEDGLTTRDKRATFAVLDDSLDDDVAFDNVVDIIQKPRITEEEQTDVYSYFLRKTKEEVGRTWMSEAVRLQYQRDMVPFTALSCSTLNPSGRAVAASICMRVNFKLLDMADEYGWQAVVAAVDRIRARSHNLAAGSWFRKLGKDAKERAARHNSGAGSSSGTAGKTNRARGARNGKRSPAEGRNKEPKPART